MVIVLVVKKLFWFDMCVNIICVESIFYILINIIDILVFKL